MTTLAYREANREKIRAAAAAYRAANRERALEATRKWRRECPDAVDAGKAAWRERNLRKHAAHVVVTNALASGALIRYPCWVCGDVAQAHHANYDAPLDVIWLCRKHHAQVHAEVRRV